MIDVKKASISLATLASLNFFPADEQSRTGILSEVCEMCSDNEQIEWLARRARRLWRKWESTYELRAVLCSKYRPADGFEVYSSLPQFADGIPSEKESAPLALAAAPRNQLASAGPVSTAASLQSTVAGMAVAKCLNRAITGKVAPKVAEIPVVRVTLANQITEADIAKAVQELRDKRAREEAGIEVIA